MADSTLDMTGEEAAVTTLGHGTTALGPSDSSDTGSDVVGGPGMDEGLSDAQSREMPRTTRGTSGRDLGDPTLESDSDRSGTGERGSAGIDSDSPNDTSARIEFDPFDDSDAVEIEQVDSDLRNITANEEGLDDVPVADGAT